MDLQTTLTMSFTTFLESISIDNDTNINALKVKFKNQQSFYKDLVKIYKQTNLVFMLEIFCKQIQMLNLYLTFM
jgi:inhibitor of KinA sporulation pathway (predicted exonuclease)